MSDDVTRPVIDFRIRHYPDKLQFSYQRAIRLAILGYSRHRVIAEIPRPECSFVRMAVAISVSILEIAHSLHAHAYE